MASSLCLSVTFGFAEEKSIVFGFVGGPKDDLVYQAASNGAEDEANKTAKEKGVSVKIEWLTPAEWNPAQQVAMIEQLSAQKVSGIAVSPIDEKALAAVIEKVVYNGIPVVAFGSIGEIQKGSPGICCIDAANGGGLHRYCARLYPHPGACYSAACAS